MTFNELVVKYASAELDAGAQEIGENNKGPFVEKYMDGHAPVGNSWCMAFCSWCMLKAAEEIKVLPYPYFVSARQAFNHYKKNGLVENDPKKAMPGDIIFYWRESPNSWKGHAGIVFSNDGKEIISIEGNIGAYPAKVKYVRNKIDNIKSLLGFSKIRP